MRRRDSRERSFRSLSYLSTPDRLQDQMNNYCGREKRRVAPWRISRVAREVPKRKKLCKQKLWCLQKETVTNSFQRKLSAPIQPRTDVEFSLENEPSESRVFGPPVHPPAAFRTCPAAAGAA